MIDTFSSAIKSNDLYLIKKLISNDHNLNLQDLEGISPLHLSCKINRTEIIKSLIDAGANVFSEDKEGNDLNHKHIENLLILKPNNFLLFLNLLFLYFFLFLLSLFLLFLKKILLFYVFL